MFFHKTTHRPLYAEALKAAVEAGFDDVLFLNLRGEVTEGAIHNIFVEKDGLLVHAAHRVRTCCPASNAAIILETQPIRDRASALPQRSAPGRRHLLIQRRSRPPPHHH